MTSDVSICCCPGNPVVLLSKTFPFPYEIFCLEIVQEIAEISGPKHANSVSLNLHFLTIPKAQFKWLWSIRTLSNHTSLCSSDLKQFPRKRFHMKVQGFGNKMYISELFTAIWFMRWDLKSDDEFFGLSVLTFPMFACVIIQFTCVRDLFPENERWIAKSNFQR